MFKSMRRSKREITVEECKDILLKGEYGVLSTTGENGYAYGIPLSYIYMNDSVYFHCAGKGQKLENLRYNNKVSFCVVGDTEIVPDKFSTKYESVILFGEAEEVFESEKIDALMGLVKKYSTGFEKSGGEYIERAGAVTIVYKININHITGKASR